ncbi:T9SS type A sorting domain-containing protein [Hymenobacter gummosus]|uniref:T9SS type A sorting domain-containing protein n=1 Tax=Hymenobacter gummosus TaxID=1776032 RepID=A0A3S0H1T0_9BACT|nr:T9SS type A sorting domain-containing protein [Hymenobacter gummosus]RTQ46055.1 T9SS type A sorting domain-containing protein [Hymenobacter gummosus]
MENRIIPRFAYKWALYLLAGAPLTAPAQTVTSLLPARHAPAAPAATNVGATFAGTGNAAVRVFSQQAGGRKTGTETRTATSSTFDPAVNFRAGETVLACLVGTPRHVWQFTTATTGGTGTFGGGADLAVGPGPLNVAVGDVNGDGHLDALTLGAAPNLGDAEISVRLGDGTGRLATTLEFSVTRAGTELALGDVDNDGDLDLLVSCTLSGGSISVYRNNGTGSFSLFASAPVGQLPMALTLGDWNADGNLDAAVYNSSSGTMSTVLGLGDGNLANRVNFTVPFDVDDMQTGDVDGDGDLDLVLTAPGSRTLRVYFNQGSSFGSPVDTYLGNGVGITRFVLGDVDADGDLDLVGAENRAGGSGPSTVRICPNNGTGTFGLGRTVPMGTLPVAVALADVDADGDLDLLAGDGLVGGLRTGTVSVSLNNGTGTFAAPSSVGVGTTPGRLALADLDADGDVDLVTANSTDNTISVRLNGPLPVPALSATALSPAAHTLAPRPADLRVTFSGPLTPLAGEPLRLFSSGSGRRSGAATAAGNTLTFNPAVDLLVGDLLHATLTTSPRSAGGGPLARPWVWQFTAAATGGAGTFSGSDLTLPAPVGLLLPGDLDGDGDLDLLSTEASQTPMMPVYWNNGAGSFQAANSTVPNYGGVNGFSLLDVDADGDLDVLAWSSAAGYLLEVWRNNGRGVFSIGPTPGHVRLPANAGARDVAVGDVDGDGDLDVAVASMANRVAVRYNDGTGRFGGSTTFSLDYNGQFVALADVDADGDLDLIVTARDNFTVKMSIYTNDGDGNFNPVPRTPTLPTMPGCLVVGDVDGDQDVDLLISQEQLGAPSGLLLNDGQGNFTVGPQPAFSANSYRLKLADVDGDDDLDIVAPNPVVGGGISIGLNNGRGLFSPGSVVAPPPVPQPNPGQHYRGGQVITADFDGDGDIDLASTPTAIGAPNVLMIRLNQNRPLTARSAAAEQFQLYPNPAGAGAAWHLKLSPGTTGGTVQVGTVLGQPVRQQAFRGSTAEVSTTGLAAGTYLLRVMVAGQVPQVRRATLE